MDFARVQYAIENEKMTTINEWLLDPSVDINTDVDGQFGSTALHWAVHYGREAIARELLSKGANPNVGNAYQATALHWACKTGSKSLVKLMIDHNGDVNLKTINNDSPLDIATEQRATEVINFLLGKEESTTIRKLVEEETHTLTSTFSTPERRASGPSKQPVGLQIPDKRIKPTTRTSMDFNIDSVEISPESSRSGASYSVGYSMSVRSASNVGAPHVAPSHSAMQALQRSKIKLEQELKNTQQMLEGLQKECSTLQLEKLRLSAKAQAADEMRLKLHTLQTEKIRLEIALKQAEADLSREKQVEKSDAGPNSQQQQETMTNLLKEKKQALEEIHKLKERFEQYRQTTSAEISNKDVELDELRSEINELQVGKVKTEVQLRGFSELKSNIDELQKEKALLEMELTGKEELQAQLEGMQRDKFEMEVQLRNAQRANEELHGRLAGLNKQVAALETDLTGLQNTTSQLEQERREKARLEIHAQTLQEELDTRKETAMNAIRGTEDAVGSLQNSLDAMRQEKSQLKQQLALEREEVSKLSQALLALQQTAQTQTAQTQEVEILHATINSLQKEAAAQEETIKKLRSSHTDLTTQYTEMQKQKIVLDVEVEDFRRCRFQLEQVEAENMRLATELKRATLLGETAQSNYEKISSERQFMEEQVNLLEDVRDAYTKLEREFGAMEEKLRAQQVEMEKLTGDRSYWESQWNLEHSKEKAQLQARSQEMERENHRLQSEMKAVVEQLLQAQMTISNLTDTKIAMEAQTIQQLRNKVVELQRANAELEGKCIQNQQAQEQLQDLAEAHDRIEAKNQEIKNLNAVISDMKSRLKTVQDTLVAERRQAQSQIEQIKQHFSSEETRIRQSCQQELDQMYAEFERESEGLRQRAIIMGREREALELQIKALQEQASFAVETAVKPKRSLLEPSALSRVAKSSSVPASLASLPMNPPVATESWMNPSISYQSSTLPEPGMGSLLAELHDLKASTSLPPLNKSSEPAARKPVPRPGAFAREQRALLKGGLY
uniref:Uncharacterized protein n=1 Tax=Eutreptiella gymnastica TaxID=73025 RepID=A0A7S1N8J9_9EUGL|mmetsp:Transcript_133894/g.232354  ORF Transcript_133894/g.232354 Transcript_133894/m.232354 type:complete len:1017 (+) Transcript_133894:120-3170(+)